MLAQSPYLWASPLLASHTLVHCVSLFRCAAYFCRGTIEADSWSWVANYVRLSPFQAQQWSNRIKKLDQTAELKKKKITLPFRSLSFRGFSSACFSLCCFLWRNRGGRSVKVYCWGSYILQVMLSMREKDRESERESESPGKQGSSIVKITECQQALSVSLKLQKLTFLGERGSIVRGIWRKTHRRWLLLAGCWCSNETPHVPSDSAALQDFALPPFFGQVGQNRPSVCGLIWHHWKYWFYVYSSSECYYKSCLKR